MVGGILPPPNMPFLNPRTGLVNTEWYVCLQGIIRFFGSGVLVGTGSGGAAVTRTIVGGVGIDVANGTGVGGNPTISDLGPDNFGFFVGGLMSNGELLGSAIFDDDVVFPSVLKPSVIVSENPATASAELVIKSRAAGVETHRGTITFAAGASTGVLAWATGAYTLPAGDTLKLYAPTVHDLTLSKITGLVAGDLS